MTTRPFTHPAPSSRGAASSPARDRRTFAELVHQTRVTLLALAQGLLGDADRAEDVVQDALLEAWAGLTPRSDLGELSSSLRRLVVARCRRELRAGNVVRIECAGVPLLLVEPEMEGEAGAAAPSWPVSCELLGVPGLPHEGEEAEEEGVGLPVWPLSRVESAAAATPELPLEQELIALALESLPNRLRRPLELRYLEGLSAAESRRVLKLSDYVFRQRLDAAVRALKRNVRTLVDEGVPLSGRLAS
jgi:DNA-directed RNA polymerase specialized sigma24 family protein